MLWNEDEQIWLDFDSSKGDSRNYFYASNLAPLWTKSYDEKLSEFYGDAAVDYLVKNNIITKDLIPRYICTCSLYIMNIFFSIFTINQHFKLNMNVS